MRLYVMSNNQVGTYDDRNLLAPDVIVLGGGLVEAMPELFLQGVEEAARQRAAPPYAKSFKVAIAKLGDDAVARGTAAWAEHCFANSAPAAS